MSLIAILWNYRRAVICALLLAIATAGLGLVYLRGKDAGKAEVQAKWDAERLAQITALSQIKLQTEEDVAKATAILNARLASRDQATVIAMKGIKDEIARNAAYRDCHLTAGGVRLYNAAGVLPVDANQDSR